MGDWPNGITTQTGFKFLQTFQRMVLGANDVRDLLVADVARSAQSVIHTLYHDPVTFGPDSVEFSESEPSAGLYVLGVSGVNKRHGTHDGNIITLDPSGADWFEWSDSQYGLTDCPYVRTPGQKYHIGCKFESYPSLQASVSNGNIGFKEWKRAFGYSGTPGSVVDDGDGTITMDVSNLFAFSSVPGGGAWASSGAYGRRVIVWLNNPVVASAKSLFVGTMYSDGANVTIDVTTDFGQSVISTTVGDYTVFMPGMVIAPEGFDMPGNGWWVWGSVTDGVVEYSDQVVMSTPGALNLNLIQLAADLYTTPSLDDDGLANLSEPLQTTISNINLQLRRDYSAMGEPHMAMAGGFSATRQWSKAIAIAPNAGTVEVTGLADPLVSGGYVMTGLGTGFDAGMLRPCTMDKDSFTWSPYSFTPSSTGEYWLTLEAEEVSDGDNPYRVFLQHHWGSAVGWSTWDDVLADGLIPLAKFTVTAIGTVALTYNANSGRFPVERLAGPYRPRGGSIANGQEAVLGDLVRVSHEDNSSDTVQMASVITERPSSTQVQVTEYVAEATQDLDTSDATQKHFQHGRHTSWTLLAGSYDVHRRVFYGPDGEAAVTANKGVALQLGGDNDASPVLAAYYSGSDHFVELVQGWNSPENRRSMLRLKRTGGAQANSINGTKPALMVPDLHLIGDTEGGSNSGKTFARPVPLVAWFNDPEWEQGKAGAVRYNWRAIGSAADRKIIIFEVPHINQGNEDGGGWTLWRLYLTYKVDNSSDSLDVLIETQKMDNTYITHTNLTGYNQTSVTQQLFGIDENMGLETGALEDYGRTTIQITANQSSGSTNELNIYGIHAVYRRTQI